LHQPDDATPIEDTLSAMTRLVDDGKVREIGCSNFSAKQLEEASEAAAEHGLRRFATVQNEYSLLHTDPREQVIPACERLGIALMPYFPLASGLLSGKYRRGETPPPGSRLAGSQERLTDERFDLVERLAAFAEQRDRVLLELALSWLASQRVVATVIAGATSAEQVRANTAAVRAWKLEDEDFTAIDEILER
jgi:aryl-alcohol dehydrogenase-like predicted oxidoreductase